MNRLHHNPDYIHHQKKTVASSLIREIVFGMEDGMVSTLGAVTGIATAIGNHYTVLLSGFVIIAVESISMGIGSYLSNKSEQEIDQRKLFEEKTELHEFPEEEREELINMYIEDGWPKKLATDMAGVASKNKKLFLQEMAYRELEIIPHKADYPFKNGLVMFVSYVVGGSVPLLPYILFPISRAIPISIACTLVGLFLLGVYTTQYTKRRWWKAGLEMLLLASAAASVGYLVGQLVEILFGVRIS